MKLDPPNDKVRGFKVELRTEVVALLSADCDLVDRVPPKRKGVLVSPLRQVPSNIAKDPDKMNALMGLTIRPEGGVAIPANQFYFADVEAADHGRVSNGVIHLETMAMLTFSDLKAGSKVAELTEAKRQDLQERIKWHFTRVEG